MRIGIITITSGLNYGNSLQNLGLLLFIQDMGIKVDTILNESDSKHIERTVVRKVKNFIKKSTNILGKRRQTVFDEVRQDKYLKFDKEYIPFSQKHILNNEIDEELNECYDFFIVGSDIVWNPVYISDVMFLKNVTSRKKIAYAASFGTESLPSNKRNEYRDALQDFQAISVREKTGKNIIKEILGKEVETCADPTLLISDTRWKKIATQPIWFNEKKSSKYVLTYFLGNIPKYVLDDIENRFGDDIEIINLLDKSNLNWYAVDPAEFLYLIDNAKLIYTDSFHGCVFSVIFKKPFFAFSRHEDTVANFNKLTSRIKNLTEMFNIKNRFIQNSNDLKNIKWDKLDYEDNERVLINERGKAMRYLKKALNME